MKWTIPAKTFLLGEYAAVAEASALIVTTTPCFELSLNDTRQLNGIHPESPAGLWWATQQLTSHGLSWVDPYQGQGGLGASSAQYLASYLACCHLRQSPPSLKEMLKGYYESSWNGSGLRPSGYDVIAQSQSGCVFINKSQQQIQTYDWLFDDLSFFLIHTGIKLATHHHLQEATLPQQLEELSALVDRAQTAFIDSDSNVLVTCINKYHQQLASLNLVAEHSLKFIEHFSTYPEILAIKGCGALGSDVLLLLSHRNNASYLKDKLLAEHWHIVATEENLNQLNKNLIKNKSL